MRDALTTYRSKRNFGITPEPHGKIAKHAARLRYVVQKHWASHLHYDLRLEIDGTMKSWAVPKGPSLDPADKRMAVQVEDHPVEYNRFEGHIPAGQYGAGKVIIWDRGHWLPTGDAASAYAGGKLKFELFGEKLRGRWTLVRMRNAGERQQPWLMIKERDAEARTGDQAHIVDLQPDSVDKAPAGPASKAGSRSDRLKASTAASRRTSLPRSLSPQLATLVDIAPADAEDWSWELKFDGYRMLARIERGVARLYTRSGHDWTERMPHVARTLTALPIKSGWIDGEVVVFDEHGKPDFQALQNAFDGGNTAKLVLYAFDLPFADGHDLRMLPLLERRQRLRDLLCSTQDNVRFSEDFAADTASLLASACKIGFEGLVGKRKRSAYASRRNGDWIKLKCHQRQEFVVAGYTDPKGSRAGLGSLLLGVHAEDGGLRYCGNVGSGFSDDSLRSLQTQLRKLVIDKSPFADAPAAGHDTHWIKPVVVAEVEFAGWTKDGRVRHAVFRGLRKDKSPTKIVREIAMNLQTDKETSARAMAPAVARIPRTSETALLSGVRITHPDRVIDASTGITKLELVRYYAKVSTVMTEHLGARPVSMVRAPDGVDAELFFQKHLEHHEMEGVIALDPKLDEGHAPLLAVAQPEGLLWAAQMNVIEFHTWNARKDRIDRPDRMTFDLDPGEGVAWDQIREATHLLHVLMQELSLPAFLKTSGGKGMHVVVPIKRLYSWDTVKDFSHAVVKHLAATIPDRFVAKSGPKNRVGKIFVDYLRNGRGATTASAWTARARPGMGVSVPVDWSELDKLTGSAHWSIRNIDARLRKGNGPWTSYAGSATTLTTAMRELDFQPAK